MSDSITRWIDELKEGDEQAAQKLWEHYFSQIVGLARRKLEGAKRAAADEEDVALSAFKSLCIGAEAGRFPKLSDRDSLWSLLFAIVVHKSTDLIRYENRRKRGGTGDQEKCLRAVPLSQIIEERASPSFAMQMSTEFESLMKKLEKADDPDLHRIAVAKMTGESNVEIAKRLGCVRRTVERKIQLIRRIWEKEISGRL